MLSKGHCAQQLTITKVGSIGAEWCVGVYTAVPGSCIHVLVKYQLSPSVNLAFT